VSHEILQSAMAMMGDLYQFIDEPWHFDLEKGAVKGSGSNILKLSTALTPICTFFHFQGRYLEIVIFQLNLCENTLEIVENARFLAR